MKFDSIYYSVGQYFIDDVKLFKVENELRLSTPMVNKQTSSRPKIWVLAVGVQDYKNHKSNDRARISGAAPDSYPLKSLNYSVADAKSIAAFWLDPAGGNLPLTQVTQLYGQVKVDEVLNAAAALFAKASSDDFILIYLTGHGGVGFYRASDDDISYSQINSVVNSSRAKKKLVVVDACHSGSIAPIYQQGARSSLEDEEITNLYYDELQKSQVGISYLLSCRPLQIAWESSTLKHGIFTHFFLEALMNPDKSNKDGDLFISLGELRDYLNVRVDSWARYEKNASQNIVTSGDFENMINLPLRLIK